MKLRSMGSVAVTAALFVVQNASAQVLFTTTNDFGLFGTYSGSYYSDSSTVNGIGNGGNPGGADGVGSLQLTSPGGWNGWVSGSGSPGQEGNQASLSAINPGSIAAWSAGSGYGPGTLLPKSGTISFDLYRGNLTSWNDWGINFNYNGYWGPIWQTNSFDFVGADGRTWTHYDVPYTLNNVNAGLTYFQIGLAENADGAIAGQTFYLDNLQVTPVPEPSTFALLGLGVLSVFFVVRRRVS